MPRNKLKQTEQELVRAMMAYLEYNKWFCWRNQSLNVKTEKGYYIRAGTRGLPDIFAVKRDYPLIGIEAKVGYNKPSDIQKETIKVLRNCGVEVVVAYDLQDLDTFIKEL